MEDLDVTLPETNIAMENPPYHNVFVRKDGDFHGAVLVSGRVDVQVFRGVNENKRYRREYSPSFNK